jgi:hypothetical protein
LSDPLSFIATQKMRPAKSHTGFTTSQWDLVFRPDDTHSSDFQGKKLSPTFVNPTAGNPFKPAAPTSSGPRPALNTQILLAHGPTNAHGGVNFNRVRPARMAQQNQGYSVNNGLGMGWPSGFVPKNKAYGVGGDRKHRCSATADTAAVIPYGSVGFDGRAVWTGQPMHSLRQ